MPYDVDIGDGADALGQNQLTDALDGTYWVSGWDATLGAGDLEVDIAAGSGAVAGTDVSTASTETIDFTGDPNPTDPRKAVIYVDSGGTVQKALGTPQPVDPSGEIRFRTYNPSPPASVSGVVVAEVWLAAGETVLESADVRDRRVANQAAVSSQANEPGWVEDANSPLIVNNASSGTISLSSSYDAIKCIITSASSGFPISIRVNGDSGSNYAYFDLAGNKTTGATEWGRVIDPARSIGQEIALTGSWEDAASANFGQMSEFIERTHGSNSNVSSPLTSIEFFNINSKAFSVTARVYGITE